MLLKHIIPAEGIVIIDADALGFEVGIFKTKLEESLKYWQAQKLKLVSLEIPIEKSIFVPILAAFGFSFHYSGKSYLVMVYQLTAQELVTAFNFWSSLTSLVIGLLYAYGTYYLEFAAS